MRRRRSFAQWSLLSFCLLLSGCAETGFEISSPSSLSFEELKQRVARIRGLSFQREVYLETTSIEAIRAILEKSLWEEYGQENLQQTARVYARLGLLPEATDLAKTLLDLRLFYQGMHQDSRGKTIFLPKGPWKPGLTFPGSSPTRENATKQILLVQALTHILQEQHFNWEEKIRNRNTGDSRLTLRALREGDALLVTLAHLMGAPQENRQKIVNGLRGLRGLPAQIDKELSRFPELLRQEVAFQYLQGGEFVSWAYAVKGWEGVNSLFQHPPLSTAQILHPEKYYVKRHDPVRITPWGLIRPFRGKMIMDETLGEFLIQSLLSQTLSQGEARQAAAGWGGDSLLAFRQGEELVLGWVTAWDDREKAREFYRSYRRALERRHGFSLESSQSGVDVLISPPKSNRSLLLQIKDHFVLFLDGIPAPRSAEIAGTIWNDLETGAEPEPLDLAGRSPQAFSVKK